LGELLEGPAGLEQATVRLARSETGQWRPVEMKGHENTNLCIGNYVYP
jgi:hypothetical protein